MKKIQVTFMACGLAFWTFGCQAEDAYPHPEGTFEVGVQNETSSGSERVMSHDFIDYRDSLSAKDYAGVSYLKVTKPGFDVTDTSDDAPEQILRVSTSRDSEVFSTWDSLQELDSALVYGSNYPPGIAGAPPGEDPMAFTVVLGFEAIASNAFQPNNGVLEIEPNSADDLTLEWETKIENNRLTASASLTFAERNQGSEQ